MNFGLQQTRKNGASRWLSKCIAVKLSTKDLFDVDPLVYHSFALCCIALFCAQLFRNSNSELLTLLMTSIPDLFLSLMCVFVDSDLLVAQDIENSEELYQSLT